MSDLLVAGGVVVWAFLAVWAWSICAAGGRADDQAEDWARREEPESFAPVPEPLTWSPDSHFCPVANCTECRAIEDKLAELFPRLNRRQVENLHYRRYSEYRSRSAQ